MQKQAWSVPETARKPVWKELPKGKLDKGEVDRGHVIGHYRVGKEFIVIS